DASVSVEGQRVDLADLDAGLLHLTSSHEVVHVVERHRHLIAVRLERKVATRSLVEVGENSDDRTEEGHQGHHPECRLTKVTIHGSDLTVPGSTNWEGRLRRAAERSSCRE